MRLSRPTPVLAAALVLACQSSAEKRSSDDSDSSRVSDNRPATDDTSDPVGADDTAEVDNAARADCDIPLDGVDWGATPVTDAEPGIEDEIDAIDFDALPDEIDISALMGLYRGAIAYALEIAPGDLGTVLDRDATLARGPMGRVVLASLAEDSESMDFYLFRRGLQRYYMCSRGYPMSLDGFEALIGEIPESYTDIDSIAKCATRRLRLDPDAGIYVSESLWEGAVRETEILLTNNRDDGQIDFVVYGADGVLTDRSQFPTIAGDNHLVTSAPYTCMSCHVNPSATETTWGYDILIPVVGPCA